MKLLHPDRLTLRQVPLAAVTFAPGTFTVTISTWQAMDAIHRVTYDEGGYLLELDDDEQPVRAYHRSGILSLSWN